MKNKDIVTIYEGLSELYNDKQFVFDIKTSFILAKNKNILEPLYDAIIQARNSILIKYGEQKGTEYTIKKENIEAFKEQVEQLMEIDNFVSLQKIKLADLDGKIGIKIMQGLLPIIEE